MTAPIRQARRQVAIYPVLFGVAYWSATTIDGGSSWVWSWRAAAISICLLLVLQLLLTFLLRSSDLAAPLSLGIWFWLLGEATVATLLVIGVLISVVFVRLRRLRGGSGSSVGPNATRAGNLIATVALILTVGLSIPNQGWHPEAAVASTVASGSSSATSRPDIFVVLLDGYPRVDTLRTSYGYDNEPFLQALEARGFDVARSSRSNYNFTALSLISMLNMQHVGEIPALTPPISVADERRAMTDLLARSTALSLLRDNGYEVSSISSPFLQLAVGPADHVIEPYPINSAELRWLDLAVQRGPLGPVIRPLEESSHRTGLRKSFEALRILARPEGTSRLIFAHIMAPHPPFLITGEGDDLPMTVCHPPCGFWDGLRTQLQRQDFNPVVAGQIEFVNASVLEAIDEIRREATVDPVIVLWSDHGGRADDANEAEMLRNLFAAHTPGYPSLFGDAPTPISIFPRLLNTYLGLDVPEPPPNQFRSEFPSVNESRLDIRPANVR